MRYKQCDKEPPSVYHPIYWGGHVLEANVEAVVGCRGRAVGRVGGFPRTPFPPKHQIFVENYSIRVFILFLIVPL